MYSLWKIDKVRNKNVGWGLFIKLQIFDDTEQFFNYNSTFLHRYIHKNKVMKNRQDGALNKVRITKDDGKISNPGFESRSLIFFLVIITQKRDWIYIFKVSWYLRTNIIG